MLVAECTPCAPAGVGRPGLRRAAGGTGGWVSARHSEHKSCTPPLVPSLLRFVAGVFRSAAVAAKRFVSRAHPEQFPSLPRSRSDEGSSRQRRETTVSKSRPIGPQAPGVAERSDVLRPKLGRHGRREIGRALEAMYEDVVKQGVPPRILELLEGLDARAGSN